MADRDPDDKRAIDACVGQKDVARRVHRVEKPLVEKVEFSRFKTQRTWVCAETHDGKWHRRQTLKIRMTVHTCGELMRETDVFREDAAEPSRTKMPKNHPKL